MAAHQLEQRHRLDRQGLQHLEAMADGAGARLREGPCRVVESTEGRQCVTQAQLGHHRVLGVAGAREQGRGFAKVIRCRRKTLGAQVQIAEIQRHLSRRHQVAVGEQLALRGPRAFGGVIMAAEHRQGHDLRHLRLRGMARQTQIDESRSGSVEPVHSGCHVALDDAGYAVRPGRQRFNFKQGGRLQRSPCSFVQPAQRLRGAQGPLGLAAPAGVAKILQRPAQGARALNRQISGLGPVSAVGQPAGLLGWAQCLLHTQAPVALRGRPTSIGGSSISSLPSRTVMR